MRSKGVGARRAKVIRALELKREIEDLITTEQYELAVILTQTLFEVRLEADLHTYAQECEDHRVIEAAIDLLPSFNLAHGRVRNFVETLIGDSIQKWDTDNTWARLREFQQLRNSLVHTGDRRVGCGEASDFLDSVLEITRIVRAQLLIAIYAYDEDDAQDDDRWVSRRSPPMSSATSG